MFQLEEYKQQHEQLLQLKENKQREIEELEQQLDKLQGDLLASSHLLSPASLCNLSTHISKSRQLHATPSSIIRLNTMCQAKTSTPNNVQEMSLTVFASAQKTHTQAVAQIQQDKSETVNQTSRDKPQTVIQTSKPHTGIENKSDKACTIIEQELPKLDTPFVATSNNTDSGFVKPLAPVKKRNVSSGHCTTPLTTTSKTHKRQLFIPNAADQGKTTAESASNTVDVDWPDAISGIHCINASPGPSMCSEFDARLLQHASSGDQYWTKKRITNYVTSCPSSSRLTKTPLSVKRVLDLKVFKKNCVMKTGPSSIKSGGMLQISSIQEDQGGSSVVIEVPIPNTVSEG